MKSREEIIEEIINLTCDYRYIGWDTGKYVCVLKNNAEEDIYCNIGQCEKYRIAEEVLDLITIELEENNAHNNN